MTAESLIIRATLRATLLAQELDILYSFRRCPYAMRARLALQVSAHRCELREVVLRDKPKELLQLSPKATVPVLQSRAGLVLEESLDIMLWCLGEQDPQGWLQPSLGSLDDMLALIARNDDEFKPQLDGYKYASQQAGTDAEQHRQEGARFLVMLDERLSQSPWLFGERQALADAALAPFVRQFANTDRAWFDSQNWPALRAWLDDFLDSPLFVSVMNKYAAWHPGAELVIFPARDETRWQRNAP